MVLAVEIMERNASRSKGGKLRRYHNIERCIKSRARYTYKFSDSEGNEEFISMIKMCGFFLFFSVSVYTISTGRSDLIITIIGDCSY